MVVGGVPIQSEDLDPLGSHLQVIICIQHDSFTFPIVSPPLPDTLQPTGWLSSSPATVNYSTPSLIGKLMNTPFIMVIFKFLIYY